MDSADFDVKPLFSELNSVNCALCEALTGKRTLLKPDALNDHARVHYKQNSLIFPKSIDFLDTWRKCFPGHTSTTDSENTCFSSPSQRTTDHSSLPLPSVSDRLTDSQSTELDEKACYVLAQTIFDSGFSISKQGLFCSLCSTMIKPIDTTGDILKHVTTNHVTTEQYRCGRCPKNEQIIDIGNPRLMIVHSSRIDVYMENSEYWIETKKKLVKCFGEETDSENSGYEQPGSEDGTFCGENRTIDQNTAESDTGIFCSYHDDFNGTDFAASAMERSPMSSQDQPRISGINCRVKIEQPWLQENRAESVTFPSVLSYATSPGLETIQWQESMQPENMQLCYGNPLYEDISDAEDDQVVRNQEISEKSAEIESRVTGEDVDDRELQMDTEEQKLFEEDQVQDQNTSEKSAETEVGPMDLDEQLFRMESWEQNPEPGTPEPEPGTQEPESGTQEPESGTPEPEPGTPEPESGTPEPPRLQIEEPQVESQPNSPNYCHISPEKSQIETVPKSSTSKKPDCPQWNLWKKMEPSKASKKSNHPKDPDPPKTVGVPAKKDPEAPKKSDSSKKRSQSVSTIPTISPAGMPESIDSRPKQFAYAQRFSVNNFVEREASLHKNYRPTPRIPNSAKSPKKQMLPLDELFTISGSSFVCMRCRDVVQGFPSASSHASTKHNIIALPCKNRLAFSKEQPGAIKRSYSEASWANGRRVQTTEPKRMNLTNNKKHFEKRMKTA